MMLAQDKVHSTCAFPDTQMNMAKILKKTNLRCLGWFLALVTALNSCLINSLVRKADHTSSSVFMFARGFTQLFSSIAFGCLHLNITDELKKLNQNKKLIAFRTINVIILVMLIFYTCKFLPIAQISVLGQLRPIITLIIAKVFLKEKLTIVHAFSTISVVTGAVLVLQPDILFSKLELDGAVNKTNLALGSTMVIVSTLLLSIDITIMRQLNILKIHWIINTTNLAICSLTSAIIAYSIFINIESFPEIPFSWESVCQDRWYIIGVCCVGFFNHFCIFKSMQYEKASIITVIHTSDVLFAFSIGLIFFPEEKYNYIHLIGSLLIVSGVLVIGIKNVIRERQQNSFKDVPKQLSIQLHHQHKNINI